MKKLFSLIAAMAAVTFALPAFAATFTFHGDLNNRFMVYTDQAQWFKADGKGQTSSQKSKDSWGEIKYRLWTEAATNDGKIKGVYAIELGALRFGQTGGTTKGSGGSFSGDGVNIETRWAYIDFALPSENGRVSIGLQPVKVNSFFWNETAMGVLYRQGGLTAGWVRGQEAVSTANDDWGEGDLDALIARYDLKQDALKAGFWGVFLSETSSDPFVDFSAFNAIQQYQVKALGKADLGLYAIGLDGGLTLPTGLGDAFIKWDAIYEGGSINDVSFDGGVTKADLDLSAFLLHADAGLNLGKSKLTYTVWYASGDDNAADTDLDGYISVDEDRFDSIIFMEGGYTDDNYFTERPYIGDKGLFLNKLALDHQATDKLKLGGALLYLMTAEDLVYTDDNGVQRSEDALGVEVDAYVSYKLFPNCEVALNAGYLFADDGMDFFEVAGERDGGADNDIFRSTARVRYKF
ncbi:MAG: hypothetical protein Tsb0017_02360 [Geothermobacteraceae bacterium]